MPKLKLTDAAVQRLQAPPGERVDYFDATLPGFALRVSGATTKSPLGRKTWVLFYRHGGKQKRLSFDPVYPALGLGAARRKAGDALELLSHGKDPAAERAAAARQAARGADTVATVVDEFLTRHMEKKKRSQRYASETRRNFENHVLPRWRDRDIRSITRRDVTELLDAIVDKGTVVRDEAGKKRRVRGGPIAANRILAAVRKMFNWAVSRGVLDSTPVALVEPPGGTEKPRDRVLSTDEIRVLWPRFEELAYPFGLFLEMALVTGQRRSEVSGMQWSEVDEVARTWTVPSARTKSGRLHVVPLSPLALEILAKAKDKCRENSKAWAAAPKGPVQLGPYVFCTEPDRPISGFSKSKANLDVAVTAACKREKVPAPEPWRIHDLRRTVATEMTGLGVARLTVGHVLNHADRSITGIYDRYAYLAEKQHALNVWSQKLSVIVGPTAPNVTELPRRQGAA